MIVSRHLVSLLLLCLVFVTGWAGNVRADQITSIEPVVKNGQLYIDADIDLAIDGELRAAAEKGVPLYFTADLEIVTDRWWWFDKVLLDQQHTWRLSHSILTRQWRVGTGDLNMPAVTFDDALAYVRHIRGWAVAPVDTLEHGTAYRGRLRMRLDTTRLPRPFRIDSFNSTTWSVVTPWKDFSFSISQPTPGPL